MPSSHTSGRTATKAFFDRLKSARSIIQAATVAAISPSPAAVQAVVTFGQTFLHEYTPAHQLAVAASAFVVLDAETTGLTPHSKPISVGASAKIGPTLTWSAYKKQNAGAALNCRVRMRVWSIQLSDGQRLVWDLDKLPPARVVDLLRDTIHDRIIIGHNLAFDLTWSVHYAGRDIKPALTLDTMLLARCLKPASVWGVHYKGADFEREGGQAARSIIAEKGNGSVSLAALSVGMDLGTPDKSWQHPRNWAVSPLSPGHYDYVLGDIDAPLELVYAWGRSRNFSDAVANLRARDLELGSSYFDVYEKAPLALAKISNTGMPIHLPTVAIVQDHCRAQIPGHAADVVKHIPAMEPHAATLQGMSSKCSAEMKAVLAAYASENGFELDTNEDDEPLINAEQAALKGVNALHGWQAWEALQQEKRTLALCDQFLAVSEVVQPGLIHRVHPLFSARLATTRVASEVPSSMNAPRPGRMPKDFMLSEPVEVRKHQWALRQFRSIIQAPEGYVLISADYSQIELRIAAALAERAIADAKRALSGETQFPDSKKWFLDALRRGEDLSIELHPSSDDESGFDGFRDRISSVWRKLCTSPVRPMADAFREGLDPHLLTGCTLAVKQGLLAMDGLHPVEWLRQNSATDEQEDALKAKFGDQRSSAKGVNFGSLYGQQAKGLHAYGILSYGIRWSLEDATESRAAWFELFSDIEFLQLWHQLVLMPGKKDAEPMYRKNPYTRKGGVEQLRLGASATLRGRPVVATESREILNYADQGSGADMLVEAITSMTPEAFDCIINLIHDEILMCVPFERADVIQAELERAMLAAADRVLAPYKIPAQADGARMPFWRKD